jgi:hypothetical protein
MGLMEWTSTVVDHQALPPSPSWAGRDGQGRSGGKGAEGPARGRQSTSLRERVSFSADHLVRCNDFKTKARCCS